MKQVDEVTELVRSLRHPVARYHGQLGARERRETQDRFMAGDLRVIVATNAFGMGIDKPDYPARRALQHAGVARVVDEESGRAGATASPPVRAAPSPVRNRAAA